MIRIPKSSDSLTVIGGAPHQWGGSHRKLVIARIDSGAILPFHADVGRASVVSLEHCALCSLYSCNNRVISVRKIIDLALSLYINDFARKLMDGSDNNSIRKKVIPSKISASSVNASKLRINRYPELLQSEFFSNIKTKSKHYNTSIYYALFIAKVVQNSSCANGRYQSFRVCIWGCSGHHQLPRPKIYFNACSCCPTKKYFKMHDFLN